MTFEDDEKQRSTMKDMRELLDTFTEYEWKTG